MSKKISLLLIIPLLFIGGIYAFNLKILLLFIFLISTIIIYISFRNSNSINKLTDAIIATVKKNNYELINIDIGESSKLKIYGIIPINTKVYHLKGIGILSIMKVNLGLMQMLTLSINPFEKDLPQLSLDIMCIFQKIILISYFYALMLDKENNEYKYFLNQMEKINETYANIENFPAKKEWHTELISAMITKKIGVNQEKIVNDIMNEVMKIYVDYWNKIKGLNVSEIVKKIAIIEEFGNNLVDKGGYSTNFFKKMFGVDTTRKFLGDVIFGYYAFKKIDINNNKKN